MATKRDLVIYHPESGTYIPLADEVYLVNNSFLDDDALLAFKLGMRNIPVQLHKGYRLDNYNMGNLFYGPEENS